MTMIVTIRTDSTANGVHSWYSWLNCPRKAWFKELSRAHREPRTTLSGRTAFDVGSIGHALLALHYSLPYEKAMQINTSRLTYKLDNGLPLDTDIHAADIEEASRLYRAYRLHHRKNDLGKVLDIEKEFEVSQGACKLSGAPDLVVKMTARDLANNSLDGSPGIYVVDHKFYGKKDPMAYELAMHEPQFVTYPKIYPQEVAGTIVNIIYKTAAPSFERFLVPKMAINSEWPIVSDSLALAARNRETALKIVEGGQLPEVNTQDCFKSTRYGVDVCRYYKDNSCNRRMS